MNVHDRKALQSIARFLRDGIDFTAGLSYEEFQRDAKTVSASAFVIGQIGEYAGRLSQDLLVAHPQIPWKAIRGMRNRIVHEYDYVDFLVIWQTLTVDFPVVLGQVVDLLSQEA